LFLAMPTRSKDVQPYIRPLDGPGARSQLKRVPGQVSAVAWIPKEDLDPREWAATGRRFGMIGRCSQWWIGDWIRYGAQKWGEKYVQAARITGYDVASLRNIAWVASQFELSLRSDKLSWSHHALLAPLEIDEKVYWLERASTERLSVADLRIELRAARSAEKRGQSQPGEPARDDLDTAVCPECGHQFHLVGDGCV
jgi:hypothetical protein